MVVHFVGPTAGCFMCVCLLLFFFLLLNPNTVLLIVKSTFFRTFFLCFLNLFVLIIFFNKIIIVLCLLHQPFSLSPLSVLSLSGFFVGHGFTVFAGLQWSCGRDVVAGLLVVVKIGLAIFTTTRIWVFFFLICLLFYGL